MSDNRVVLKVEDVKKDFYLPHSKSDTFKESFTQKFKSKKKGGETYHALNGISFEIKKGDFFGVVGRNGAGKSTLLRILAEIYQPTSGTVWHHGKLVPFIELGVGFNNELSARQNVYLNGAMLGFSKKEMDERYDSIVEFAELERFMDQKLKNFSSGMRVRLAFSVAIQADADILLLDEVLAVGDAAFKRKCFDYFNTLKDNKKTVILVSHGMNAIRDYCNRAILIENGKVAYEGSADEIADRYTELFETNDTEVQKYHHAIRKDEVSNKKAHFEGLELHVLKSTLKMNIDILAAKENMYGVKLSVMIKNHKGQIVAGIDNLNSRNAHPIDLLVSKKRTVSFEIDNIFADRDYTLVASLSSESGEVYDLWDDITHFSNDKNEELQYPVVVPGKFALRST